MPIFKIDGSQQWGLPYDNSIKYLTKENFWANKFMGMVMSLNPC